MRILNRERGSGNTSMLIDIAFATGQPIVTSTFASKKHIVELIKNKGFDESYFDIYTVDEWCIKSRGKKHESILVDNLDLVTDRVFKLFFGIPTDIAVMSVPMVNIKK